MALDHKGGQVKLGRQPAVFAQTHVMTVAKQIEHGVGTIENDPTLALEIGTGQVKISPIDTGRIVHWHSRWIHGEGILHIGVDRSIVALQLPIGGHRLRFAKGIGIEHDCIGHRLGPFEVGKGPITVKQASLRADLRSGLVGRAVAGQRRVGRQAIVLHQGRILPSVLEQQVTDFSHGGSLGR